MVLSAPDAVAGGLSAGGHDVVQPGVVEVYLPTSGLDVLYSELRARPASRAEANVIARVPNTDFWPLGDRAGRLAVAFDLWDAADARSRRAAENLYRSVLESKQFAAS